MNGCVHEWMQVWMDAWMYACMNGWMDACMNGCMHACTHERMNGCMHEWMMHEWMDAFMHAEILLWVNLSWAPCQRPNICSLTSSPMHHLISKHHWDEEAELYESWWLQPASQSYRLRNSNRWRTLLPSAIIILACINRLQHISYDRLI